MFKIFKLISILTFVIQAAGMVLSEPTHAAGKAYRIGVNDVLSITIYAGGEIQNEMTVTVSAKGTINAPFIGPVTAVDLTPSELEERITKPLGEAYFVDPKVNVQIKTYRSQYYYISGAVKSPGLYYLTAEATLLVLIAEAGGVLSERGDQAHIIKSEGGKAKTHSGGADPSAGKAMVKVDLQKLLEKGDLRENPSLSPGDMVYIPIQETLDASGSKIYVEGEVKHPGAYDFKPGLTALNACIMAGGFDTFAAPNRSRIIRNVDGEITVIKINLNSVKAGKKADVQLKAGDRLHIPETWL